MKIYVTVQSQGTTLIEIDERATVSYLKKEISTNLIEIEIIDYILTYKSKVLLDDDTMNQSGIIENSVIELIPTKRANHNAIKMSNTQEFVENVGTSVREILKKYIDDVFDIQTEIQRLFMDTNEIHNVTKNRENVEPKLEIRLQMWQDHPNRYHKLLLPKNYTISQLRDHVENCYEIPVEFQTLHFNNKVLDSDEKTLKDLGINDQAMIIIQKNDIEIFIETTLFKVNSNILPLRVFPSDTIEQVKGKIERKLNFTPTDQELFLDDSILNDCDILQDMGIKSGAVLYLILMSQILYLNIQVDNQNTKIIICDTTETVGQLKLKIGSATKIPVAKQILYCNNQRLMDDNSLLIENGINEMSTIVMENSDNFFTINVYVTRNGIKAQQPITVRIDKRKTVINLKKKIMILTGIKTGQQYFTDGNGSNILTSNSTLNSVLQNGSNIYLQRVFV